MSATKATITRRIKTEELRLDNLAIYSVERAKAGKVKGALAYLDTTTGEIIKAEDLPVPVLDLRDRLTAKEAALNSIRPEPRAFAVFVLKFANKRRGITPGIDALCQWYADIHGKRSQDVRRYIPALTKAGILWSEGLLGPLFQRTGGRARDHLSEYTSAENLYLRMRRNAQAFDPSTGSDKRIAPPNLVANEVAWLDAELAFDREDWACKLAEAAIAKVMLVQQAAPIHIQEIA